MVAFFFLGMIQSRSMSNALQIFPCTAKSDLSLS